jgi:hypothetical protein
MVRSRSVLSLESGGEQDGKGEGMAYYGSEIADCKWQIENCKSAETGDESLGLVGRVGIAN